ncbi:glucose-6-phosphate isomerase [Thiothrix eikelboomii]|uniref:Glucose-6-phosphate isomerase n=1 Tax=Thiothrix eikelboomii TaxID=92487 RepID=A0A1T4WA85_9GAMM|nr:glucose-6-phosphate isomerase [Thiothrix eikelboomii]SKA74244.1 glucose-6-phosphate isomerase [Thiothrix eikelboomii]
MQANLAKHWSLLQQHAERLKSQPLCDLFAADAERFSQFSVHLDDLLMDFSKEKIDQAALAALLQLAQAAQVEARRDAMVQGEKINSTEQRAVLHMALRDGIPAGVQVDGQDVLKEVAAVRERFLDFAEAVRTGAYKTVSGQAFTDVVNIGIGGSDLGPVMVTTALAPWHDGPAVHFVSNVDGAHSVDTLKGLNPQTTLVIVASKTFTTAETMLNFSTALAWLKASLGEQAGQHVAAVSTNLAATRSYGIEDTRVFGFWDWVGGRYSVWSAIGLPVAIAVGKQAFTEFLAGAKAMDEHFRSAPLAQNLPVLFALLGIWRRNLLQYPTVALIPYDQHLARFPAYVQQLDMESNGKRVQLDGSPIQTSTGPVIWGEPGTNAQHSFFQLIHQGSEVIPVDFLAAANPSSQSEFADLELHHETLLTNVLAQAQALAFGRDAEAVRADLQAAGLSAVQIEALVTHRTFPGDRPSTLMLYRQLTPYTLGRLVALFEHKVFVQGVIWGVNSYDQWGVELGKKLANVLAPALHDRTVPAGVDASTAGLLQHIHALRA